MFNCLKNANIRNFLKYFFSCLILLVLLRFCITEKIDLSKDIGYEVSFAAFLTLGGVLWNYSRRYSGLAALFVIQYVLAANVKRFFGMIIMDREIVHTAGLAVILFVSASMVLYVAKQVKLKICAVILKTAAYILYGLFLLPPLMYIGYAAVNEGLFSTDIILTFFQTNLSEISAYLQYQSAVKWLLGSMSILIVVVSQLYAFSRFEKPAFNKIMFGLTCLMCLYLTTQKVHKLNLSFAVNIIQSTEAVLQSFEDFSQAKEKRLQNLEQLRALGLETDAKGVYVLVIGESETSDHMQVYGYQRPTTPWLTQMAENENTFVFQHAYANHTHTIPTLTYALSAKNQYNRISLVDSYSIVEAAKAAGYKVYWLSNQIKFSVSETPVTVMASVADVEKWINNNTGDKLITSYYDDHLVDELPDNHMEKALIILHLMGNHSTYQDRYPAKYSQFRGKERRIDAYDNSILYNDEVLRQIYEKVKKNPYFMAMVYFSDHGDDPDNGLGHECSRFSYRMARIPFIVSVSERFKEIHADQFDLLKQQQNQYWTNDLLYEFMTELMKINVNVNNKYNLLSSEYSLPQDEVLLLHGQRGLK